MNNNLNGIPIFTDSSQFFIEEGEAPEVLIKVLFLQKGTFCMFVLYSRSTCTCNIFLLEISWMLRARLCTAAHLYKVKVTWQISLACKGTCLCEHGFNRLQSATLESSSDSSATLTGHGVKAALIQNCSSTANGQNYQSNKESLYPDDLVRILLTWCHLKAGRWSLKITDFISRFWLLLRSDVEIMGRHSLIVSLEVLLLFSLFSSGKARVLNIKGP